jgi:site-specific DNA-methyltransferase (adenine-specific)
MEIKLVKLSEIKSNPNNPRIIKDDKFRKLVNSIQEFPKMLEIRPIVVNADMIVLGGNMRLKACKEAGLKEVPVIFAHDLTDEEQKQFIIKDNVGFGEWDWDMIANEWDEVQLQEWGLDIPDFGVTEIPAAEEDDYEMPEELQTDIVLGDLFEIGEHRLLCGDSTDSDAVAKLMNGQKSDMVFTDPPYGENINFSYLGHTTKQKHKNEIIKNDDLNGNSLEDFLISILSNLKLFNNGAYYVCSGFKQLPIFQNVFNHNMLIVWNKIQLGFGMGDYRNQLEFILYNKNEGNWYGDNSQRNLWEINRENDNKLHPTIKPIDLLNFPLKNSSKENDLILDLFLGSGSTMVAAHQLKRKCYGIELDPKYCQVIVDRMKKLDPSLVILKNGIAL